MCNIAGYVGAGRAAPALIEMMSRQEGWGGGYYTGIATLHEGALHTRKVVGDLARLLAQTDAAELPGQVGILHSRSPSGGDREWAHPFTTADATLAYVANGHLGAFAPTADVNGVAARLQAAGYAFRSHTPGPVGTYPALADGSCIHFSDLMCALIHLEAARCGSLWRGMAQAYAAFPGEIVGLAIGTADPEAVQVARISMPMMLGRTADATLLATTALAFPEAGVDWLTAVPPNTALRVTRDGFAGIPLEPIPAAVADVLPWAQAEAAVRAVLADGQPHDFGALAKPSAAFWPGDRIPQSALLIYEILRGLQRTGRLDVVTRRVPGALPDLTAPRFSARLRPDVPATPDA